MPRPRLARVSAYISNHAWITGDLPPGARCGRRALELAERARERRARGGGKLPARPGPLEPRASTARRVHFFERCGTAEEPGGEAARYGPSGWPTEFGLAELSLYYVAAPLTELGRFDEALAAAQPRAGLRDAHRSPVRARGLVSPRSAARTCCGGGSARPRPRCCAASRCAGAGSSRSTVPWLAAALGYAYALAGRVSKGLSILRGAVDEADRLGNVSWTGMAADRARRGAAAGRASRRGGGHGESSARAVAAARASAATKRGRCACTPTFARRDPACAPDEARDRYQEALVLAGALEMRPLEARCHLGLAALHLADGRAGRRAAARASGNRDVPGHGHAALADPGAAVAERVRARNDTRVLATASAEHLGGAFVRACCRPASPAGGCSRRTFRVDGVGSGWPTRERRQPARRSDELSTRDGN